MARTVTWEELRDLAAVQAERGLAISLYLDLDPSAAPTAGDAQTRLNSLLDQGAKANGAGKDDLTHSQRVGLKEDFERIRRYFDAEFSRDGAQGVAVFCAGLDGVWRPLSLTETVPDGIRLGHELYLAPLVPLVGRGEGALVVVVSREQGRLYRLRAGRLEELADLSERQPRRHDQGGWSQANRQRHVDELAQEHLRRVGEEVDRRLRRLEGSQLVVAASEDTWSEFDDLLAQESRSALAGVVHVEAHAHPAELLAAAEPLLERRRAEREAELVERWREEAGRDGRASSGWGATLEAVSDGRVELLLYQEGAARRAKHCPACGRLAAEGDACPLDGMAFEDSEDGLNLAVRRTLAHGGTVWALRGRRDLDPVEGIGALLRF